MFQGIVYNSIDDKNRMIVPSKLRAELGTRCVLTKGLDKCLYIYPMSEWEKQAQKISELPKADPEVRAFIRHYFGGATECEFDSQGRIVISADLRNYAGIIKELVTIGAMEKIEVWSKDAWADPVNEAQMEQEDFSACLIKYNF